MTNTRPSRHVAPLAGVQLVYGVVLRQIISRGRIIGLGLLSCLAIVIGFALGASEDVSVRDGVDVIGGLAFTVIIPAVSLVFASGALGDLREDRTLVYFWLRPLDRWPIVVGAVLAAITVVLPLTLVPIGISAILSGVGNGIVGGTLLASAAAVVAYVAVFTTFAVYLKRPIVWGLAYILIFEGFIASAGAGIARFSIRKYTRSILQDQVGIPSDKWNYSVSYSIMVLAAVALVAVVVASRRLDKLDVD